MTARRLRRLERQGLYDPFFEHDACGVGFVANINGDRSHDIVRKGLQVLREPRPTAAPAAATRSPATAPACWCRSRTSSCARRARRSASSCRRPASTASAWCSCRATCASATTASSSSSKIVREEGQRLLGWRQVPVDDSKCGSLARENLPEIRQVFIGRGRETADEAALERKLFVIRKRIERLIRESSLDDREFFYVPSLSARTLVYKGLLLPEQIPAFYPDLVDPRLQERPRARPPALQHQHASRSWDRAHPYRFMAHNGEINTLRGNINWMHARQSAVRLAAVRRRHEEDPADHRAERQRLGDVRQRPGAARPHRALAAARGDDDDPRGVAEPRVDEREQAGVLRVPRLPDGAVGRPGVDRVHRRHA